MDQGFVSASRDGVTLQSPARFGLIALDEGIAPDEHPPVALLDRMAFHIDLTIVSPRDASEPPWDETTLSAARDRLAAITAGDAAVDALCGTAMALGIDSIRAPILALRAARAAAAFAGRRAVTEADLILASRLVLAPRARYVPPADEMPPEDEAPPADGPEAKPEPDSPDAADNNRPDSDTPVDRPLQDVVLDATRASLPGDLLARLALESGPIRSRQSGRMGQFQLSTRRGRPIGVRQGRPRGGARLNLLATLQATHRDLHRVCGRRLRVRRAEPSGRGERRGRAAARGLLRQARSCRIDRISRLRGDIVIASDPIAGASETVPRGLAGGWCDTARRRHRRSRDTG
jgi:magnesium chelatase subunit D